MSTGMDYRIRMVHNSLSCRFLVWVVQNLLLKVASKRMQKLLLCTIRPFKKTKGRAPKAWENVTAVILGGRWWWRGWMREIKTRFSGKKRQDSSAGKALDRKTD